MIKPRTLSGFMELLPPGQAAFERMSDTIRECYKLYGFTGLDTPVLEAADVLLAKGGGETEKQVYRFSKGDTELAMRFDLTVPLAKYVALNHANLTFPFRRFQIGKVYRGERAQRGRFREFYQADIDIVGDGTLDIANEAEIPAVIYKVFSTLGFTRFCIKVNNRKVLGGLFELLGVAELSGDIMRTIDKLDKIGRDKVSAILGEMGVEASVVDRLLDLLESPNPLETLEGLRGQNLLLDLGIDELATVARYIPDFGLPETHFKIDLTIARGLDYYTGTVYETVMLDHPEIGSICSGGRYDNLAGYYTDKALPGVGISIGLTRLFYVLEEQGMLNDRLNTAPCDVLIVPMDRDLTHAIRTATTMRDAGIRVNIHAETKKIKQKFSYADRLGIPFVVVLGEDEAAAGTVTIKELASGTQQTLTPGEAVAVVLASRCDELIIGS